MKVAENEIKGNTVNFALINNTAQVNTDINANLKNNIKIGPIKLIEACWGNMVLNYITNYELKKQGCINLMNQKAIEKIPNENYVDPKISVIGPVLDNLKYNLDEEHIKCLFTNLLVCEMDNRKQNRVLPAYIEIIKQLSNEDAEFLINLKDVQKNALKVLFIKTTKKSTNQTIDYEKVVINDNGELLIPSPLVLDNLERLNIIEVTRMWQCAEGPDVKSCFDKYKKTHLFEDKNEFEFSYDEGSLIIKNFGLNFIDICCS